MPDANCLSSVQGLQGKGSPPPSPEGVLREASPARRVLNFGGDMGAATGRKTQRPGSNASKVRVRGMYVPEQHPGN